MAIANASFCRSGATAGEKKARGSLRGPPSTMSKPCGRKSIGSSSKLAMAGVGGGWVVFGGGGVGGGADAGCGGVMGGGSDGNGGGDGVADAMGLDKGAGRPAGREIEAAGDKESLDWI